jgi:hypothetical protein
LCAHIRVPSLPLKKDRYKPERNGSPNVPLILQVRLALLRAFPLLRAVDALNLFKRLIVPLIPPNVSHVHRMIATSD